MDKIKAFNENDIESLKTFHESILKLDQTQVNDEFIWFHVNKSVNVLNATKQSEYKDARTQQLLAIISDLLFKCIFQSQFIIEKMIKSKFYQVYSKIIKYELKQDDLNRYCLHYLFSGLNSLTVVSDVIARENIRRDIINLAVQVFKKGDFISRKNLSDDSSIGLYDIIVKFLLNNSNFKMITRPYMVENGVADMLINHLNEINENKKEVKYIKVWILLTIVNLFNEEVLVKMNKPNEIVENMIEFSNEAIQNTKQDGKIYANTRYYSTYTIHTVCYTTLSYWLFSLSKLAVNDMVKQMLSDTNITEILKELLENGNEREKVRCCELACLLCFNEKFKNNLKNNGQVVELIRLAGISIQHVPTKRNCMQIIKMVNDDADKRIERVEGKTANRGLIRISCHQKNMEMCMSLSTMLKQRGMNVFFYTENDNENYFESMFESIESASILLVCYTEEYKTSCINRYEVDYGIKLNKNMITIKLQSNYIMDGWLKSMLQNKPHVNLDENATRENFEQLISQINKMIE